MAVYWGTKLTMYYVLTFYNIHYTCNSTFQLLSSARMDVVRYEEKLKTYSFVDRSWDSAQQLYNHLHSEMHTLYDVSIKPS